MNAPVYAPCSGTITSTDSLLLKVLLLLR
jgi:hypothetical protein